MDDMLDRYSLKERLEGFSLGEVLSLFEMSGVREYVNTKAPLPEEKPPPDEAERITEECRRLCREVGGRMEGLQQELHSLVSEVRQKDRRQAELEQENRSLREALARLPGGMSPAEIRIAWEREGERRTAEKEVEKRRRDDLVRILKEFKSIPLWHPFFRRKSALLRRKLERLLTD